MITLRTLSLSNFVCIESADFDFTNDYITIYYGENYAGKCVSGTTKIITKQYGELFIQELAQKLKISNSNKLTLPPEPLDVWTDEGWKPIEALWITSPEPMWELKLEDGITLQASADHRIMTQRGWVKLKDLQSDDEVLWGD